MKKAQLVMYSTTLLSLLCCACTQAQQSLASTKSNSDGGNQVKNVNNTGTADYVPLWLNGTTLGNSNIFQSSGEIGIGTGTPTAELDVNGAVNASSSFNLGGTPFAFGVLSISNAFVGFSGNSTVTGSGNTAD